jgi:nucleoside-diphosphate kinase
MKCTEFSFFIIKPDSFKYNQQFDILKYISENGFNIIFLTEIYLSKDILSMHYFAHKKKEFYNDLVSFMSSGKVFIGIVSGTGEVVKKFKLLVGETDPKKSKKFTIRNIYAYQLRPKSFVMYNAIHCSEDSISAKKEIKLFLNYFNINKNHKILDFIKKNDQ